MLTEVQNEILLALRGDDVKAFTAHMQARKNNLTLRYGRFPLLSLVYYYKARRIAKRFEAILLPVVNFEVADEPQEVMDVLGKRLGRALRLYVGGEVVTPCEMLCILGEFSYLAGVYPAAAKTQNTENLRAICQYVHGCDIVQTGGRVGFPRQKPKRYQMLVSVAALAVAAVFLASGVLVAAAWGHIGFGTADKPLSVNGARQLANALRSAAEAITLSGDIEVDGGAWEPVALGKTLNGNGHTLTVKNPSAPLFSAVSERSVLTDLTVAAEVSGQFSPEADFGMVANVVETGARIENVTVTLSGTLAAAAAAVTETSTEHFYSAFAADNRGTIADCALRLSLTLTGDGAHNLYFGGFAGRSGGTIERCEIDAGSLAAVHMDVGAAVGYNEGAGIVQDVTNRAAVSQASSGDGWSPQAGGIAAQNDGTMKNCRNFGAVSATCAAEASHEGGFLQAAAGGLVAVQRGIVEDCRNAGTVSAVFTHAQSETLRGIVLVGGIAALSSVGVIKKCLNTGDLSAAVRGQEAQLGGIAGNLSQQYYGYIPQVTGSGATGALTVANTDGNPYLIAGGLVGYAAGGQLSNSFAAPVAVTVTGGFACAAGAAGIMTGYLLGNYYLDNPVFAFGAGTLTQEPEGPVYTEVSVQGNMETMIKRVAALDELKALEVWWE
jgi:hypothetical protein